jgi:HEAT repeat protein
MTRCKPLLVLWVALFVMPHALAQDVNALVGQLQSSDANARRAAVDALAKVGAPAVSPLFKSLSVENPTTALWARNAVTAIVHHAARPNADKERAAVAAALIEVVNGVAAVPVRSFAVELLSFVGREDAAPALAELLTNGELREVARWSLERIPGRAATDALARAVAKADATFKVALVKTLGARGDAATTPTVIAALKDASPEVVHTAIAALGHLPDRRSEAALQGAMRTLEHREMARDALLHLAEAFHAKGDHRSAERIYRRLYESAATEHEKCAGLRGLAQVGSGDVIVLLWRALGAEETTVRGVARELLVTLRRSDMTGALLNLLPKTPDADTRALMISIVGERGVRAAATPLMQAAKDANETVRVAALRALGQLREAQAVPLFLSSLRDSSMEARAAGLDALTRASGATESIIQFLAGANSEERAALARTLGLRGDRIATAEVIRLAQDNDEAVQVAAIEALGQLRDPAGAAVVLSALKEGNGGVRNVAAIAAVPIADALRAGGKNQEAVELYTQAFPFTTNSNQARHIARRLQALGVSVDLSKVVMDAGFIAHWWTLGPLPDRNALRQSDVIPTNAPPNLAAEVRHGNQTFRWKPVRLEDPTGRVDLERVVARQDNVGAYLYTEVTSDAARDVTFKIGSDDDVVVWLNGKPIHRNLVDRAWTVDQDQIPTRLEAGVNRILVKVLQGGGQWAVSVRVTDRSGQPLRLEQKRAG